MWSPGRHIPTQKNAQVPPPPGAFYKYGCNCHCGLSMRANKVDELENKDKKWQTWGIMLEISVSNLETRRYGSRSGVWSVLSGLYVSGRVDRIAIIKIKLKILP